MNLKTLDWDDYMLSTFGVNKKNLPKIINSSDNFGEVKDGVLKGISINGVIGDQQAACIGHVLDEFEVKNTFGTGCFILMNTGKQLLFSEKGLLTTVLYKSEETDCLYALEGAVETAGSGLQWLKHALKFFDKTSELDPILNSVKDNGGICFVPAFSGLFSPHWDSSARGLLIGLTHYTEKGHILRALYEAIGFRTLEILSDYEKHNTISKIKVDGGMSESKDFLQIQSNITQKIIEKPNHKEVTIIGSAIAAGLFIKIWQSFAEVKQLLETDSVINPSLGPKNIEKDLSQWNKAVERCKNWSH